MTGREANGLAVCVARFLRALQHSLPFRFIQLSETSKFRKRSLAFPHLIQLTNQRQMVVRQCAEHHRLLHYLHIVWLDAVIFLKCLPERVGGPTVLHKIVRDKFALLNINRNSQ